MRRLLAVLMMLALAASLGACGRKGRLIPPEESTYPRQYPNISYPDGHNGPPVPRKGKRGGSDDQDQTEEE